MSDTSSHAPRSVARAAWPALALAVAALLPFLGKAHTIDDVIFLSMAEHALHDPLHPTAFDLVADGSRIRLSSKLVTGPVMAWLLAPAAALGGAEWAAHLLQLVLLIAAILATVSMALQLGQNQGSARLAGLLLAATPAVLPMATTSMADVPAMAFGALALERVLRFRDSRRLRDGALATLLLAIAALTRSHLAFLMPVSVLLLHDRRQQALAVGAIAAALFMLMAGLTGDPVGSRVAGGFLGPLLARFDLASVPQNLTAYLVHLVLVLPLGFAWLVARPSRLARSAWTWASLVVGIVMMAWTGDGPAWLLAPVAALGLAALIGVAQDARRGRDFDSAGLLLCLVMPLLAAGYEHLPAKYMAAAAPMAALLSARALVTGSRTAFGYVLVVAGLALSLLVIHADAEFADAGRRAAREMIASRVTRGERVWAIGNWGFQWYATKAGAIPLAVEPPHPASGDLVVLSVGTQWRDPRELLPPAELLESHETRSTLGRIMSAKEGAGYYSNGWGLWPWTPANGTLESVSLWRVK